LAIDGRDYADCLLRGFMNFDDERCHAEQSEASGVPGDARVETADASLCSA